MRHHWVVKPEQWLQLASLALSVMLHVGLVAAGWQGLRPLPAEERPIVVDLVSRPSPLPVKPVAGGSGPGRTRLAAVPRVPAARPAAHKAEQPKVSPVTTLPAATEADKSAVEESGSNAGDSSTNEGEGTGWGNGRTGHGTRRPASEVLIKATPRDEFNATPVYPDGAKENRWEGTVIVRARVTATGDVESVTLERSSGHAMLDRSALDAVRQWRFIPATRNGVPVGSDVSVQVPFLLPE
jgi:protein TonB